MRSLLTIKFRWLAVGVGILILIGGISVPLSLLQPNQSNSSPPVTNEVRPARLETAGKLPSLPAGNNPVSDLAEPDAGRIALGPIAAEDVAMNPLAEPDPVGVDPGMIAADDVAMSDSAELEFREEDPPAPRGGPGDVASFQDGADLVVRDANGNIKQQITVR